MTRWKQLPRGWKVADGSLVCRICRTARYRLKSITIPVAELAGATSQDLWLALEKSEIHKTPLRLPGKAWKVTLAEGGPIGHVFLGGRWWTLQLKTARPAGRHSAVYEQLASGQALAGEARLERAPVHRGSLRGAGGDREPQSGMVFRIVVWLPLDQYKEAQREEALSPQSVAPARIRDQNIEELTIGDLRSAIRSNWVSFPSQVPVFSKSKPDLQRRLVQLYFVSGWTCADIAARYGLATPRVRDILKAWKRRATLAGFIQQIPPLAVSRRRRHTS